VKRPAILLVTPYYPPDVGGVESYVCNLARMLRDRHGRRVVVATTSPPEVGAAAGGDDEIRVYRLPVTAKVSNTPIGFGWVRQLRQIIAQEAIGLVNAHAPVPLFADAAARAGGDTVPFVLTYHTGRMRKGRWMADLACAGYERIVLTGTARRARQIVCSSDYVPANLPQLAGDRTTVVSPGVDTRLFSPAPLPADQRVIFAGSLEEATAYKGLADLLHALVSVRTRVPAVHLDIVGSGSAVPRYRELVARLGLGACVTFHGRLAGTTLADAYRRARTLALPTHYDSFPTVLVEAMACGRPVVTTGVGGIPSIVRDGQNGRLVQPGGIADLSTALVQMLTQDEMAARLGAAGRARVERELSWDRQSDRTVEVFERAGDRVPGPLVRRRGSVRRGGQVARP
jgi:glycosyltransferase involved in cell wall biosynthesis